MSVKGKTKVVLCEKCGQELTDPASQARGLGPECAMSQSAQFAAISNLILATTTGYFDAVAAKFLREKALCEAALDKARKSQEYFRVKRLTKELQRITGILVRRELQRQARNAERQVA